MVWAENANAPAMKYGSTPDVRAASWASKAPRWNKMATTSLFRIIKTTEKGITIKIYLRVWLIMVFKPEKSFLAAIFAMNG